MSLVDHLVVVVADLDEGAQRWKACAGLDFVRAGRHPGGTENALAVFPDRHFYVELVSVYEPTADNPWTRRAAEGPGPLAWALAVDDLDSAAAAVSACGLAVSAPQPGSRTTPEGRVITWRSSFVGGSPGAHGWPFLIEWPLAGAERLGVAARDHGSSVLQLSVRVPDVPFATHVLTAALQLRVTEQPHRLTDGAVTVSLQQSQQSSGPIGLALAGSGPDVALDGLQVRQAAAVH